MRQTLFFCCPKAGIICRLQMTAMRRRKESIKMSYMTAGKLQAFEALMKEVPGFDHYDSGCDGICPECRSCRFHRPHWKYQSCVFDECPYYPVKLSTRRTAQDEDKES